MNLENFRFSKLKLNQICNDVRSLPQETCENKSFTHSELNSATTNSKVTNCLKWSDFESNISYCDSTRRIPTSMNVHQDEHYPTDFPESVTTDEEIISSKATDICSSLPKEIKSSESFLATTFNKQNNNCFSSAKDNLSCNRKNLRLFNRNGKPLTDSMGRPLLSMFGQPLVNIDDEGRLISDVKGNQVFNSLGESAIYPTTNLYILPSDEEPGIPLLDVETKHILFLYDNLGHPLTDSSGQPLLKASGNLMFGISPAKKLDLNNFKEYSLKTIYSKVPLENFVRLVQIFDYSSKPLTDFYGKPLKGAKIICNKDGMPMCDENGNPLFFKYGARIDHSLLENNINYKSKAFERTTHNFHLKSSKDSFHKPIFDSKICVPLEEYCLAGSRADTYICRDDKLCDNNSENIPNNKDLKSSNVTSPLEATKRSLQHIPDLAVGDTSCYKEQNVHFNSKIINSSPTNKTNLKLSCRELTLLGKTSQNMNDLYITQKGYICATSHNNKHTYLKNALVKNEENSKSKAVILFDGSKKIGTQKSSSNELAIKDVRNGRISHSFMKRKPYKSVFRTSFLQYFKNAVNMTNLKYTDDRPIFNDYGKPMKDCYGNLLYDKYGIPLTGADGIKLSEKARQVLRLKLRNIPINKEKTNKEEALLMTALTYNKSCDQYGDPYYDKHGRPLYDQFGKLIYDIYGRPLTDAFNRPLIDAIGQPLMDSKGNVLTSDSTHSKTMTMVDIFGRHLYDKRGRALFDSYGRPRFDIYSNAIYDVCGRPATDGNGIKLYDFLNNAIQPYPDKPLCKNARTLLPKYIDRILSTPSLHLVLKYSQASLKDVFGGPLFDDFGKPLYNKIGKPLYDKYGRPLYDKDGSPLCDRYGRPLSEEIRQSPNDATVSVVDSLKLLKLTKESSMWMEIKRSQTQALKNTKSRVLDDAVVMKINQPTKNKSTQYTYALTRVTTFTCGRQALEILEAPLSPATAKEMHHLPIDNKPLIMVARRRKRITRRHRLKHN